MLKLFINCHEVEELTSGFHFPKQNTKGPSANKKACKSGLIKATVNKGNSDIKPCVIYTREVSMAGYWRNCVFTCSWTETEPRSKNTQKIRKSRTRLVNKGFIIWDVEQVFLRNTAGNYDPERATQRYVARSDNQSEHRSRFISTS